MFGDNMRYTKDNPMKPLDAIAILIGIWAITMSVIWGASLL